MMVFRVFTLSASFDVEADNPTEARAAMKKDHPRAKVVKVKVVRDVVSPVAQTMERTP